MRAVPASYLCGAVWHRPLSQVQSTLSQRSSDSGRHVAGPAGKLPALGVVPELHGAGTELPSLQCKVRTGQRIDLEVLDAALSDNLSR